MKRAAEINAAESSAKLSQIREREASTRAKKLPRLEIVGGKPPPFEKKEEKVRSQEHLEDNDGYIAKGDNDDVDKEIFAKTVNSIRVIGFCKNQAILREVLEGLASKKKPISEPDSSLAENFDLETQETASSLAEKFDFETQKLDRLMKEKKLKRKDW